MFDDPSIPAPGTAPQFTVILGPMAAGKTAVRKARFHHGLALIDAADIFLKKCGSNYPPFPGDFEKFLGDIGRHAAERAIRECRNILTEIIPTEAEPMTTILQTIKALR